MRVSVVGSLLFRFTAYLSPSSPPSHQVRASVPPSTARCWWCNSSISPYPSTMWQAICNIPNGVTLRYLPFCTYFSTKKNGRSYWYIRKIVYFCKKIHQIRNKAFQAFFLRVHVLPLLNHQINWGRNTHFCLQHPPYPTMRLEAMRSIYILKSEGKFVTL